MYRGCSSCRNRIRTGGRTSAAEPYLAGLGSAEPTPKARWPESRVSSQTSRREGLDTNLNELCNLSLLAPIFIMATVRRRQHPLTRQRWVNIQWAWVIARLRRSGMIVRKSGMIDGRFLPLMLVSAVVTLGADSK